MLSLMTLFFIGLVGYSSFFFSTIDGFIIQNSLVSIIKTTRTCSISNGSKGTPAAFYNTGIKSKGDGEGAKINGIVTTSSLNLALVQYINCITNDAHITTTRHNEKRILFKKARGGRKRRSRIKLYSATSSRSRQGLSTITEASTAAPKKERRRSWISSTTSITGKWKEFFDLLQAYQAQHGHTRVPYNYTPNPQLGRWVARQRMLYRNYKQANKKTSSSTSSSFHNNNSTVLIQQQRPATALTPERIQALKSINFSFESPRTHTWSKRYDELCIYKSIHGDCLVPKKYDTFPGLGVWVRNQRTLYRNLQNNNKGTSSTSSLSKEKIAALQSIGFVWDTQRNDLWKKRFDELIDFRNVHGHCFVPEKYHENPQLGSWVVNQRTSYKNFLAGLVAASGDGGATNSTSSSGKSLTKEKIIALESIGFCWAQTAYNWYSMFYRLKQYKEEQKERYISKEKEQQKSQSEHDDENIDESTFSSTHDSSIAKMENDGDYGVEDDADNEDINLPEFFQVPPEDVANRDLRLWIAVQRKEYSNWLRIQSIKEEKEEVMIEEYSSKKNTLIEQQQQQQQDYLQIKSNALRSSMTPRRIRALESIGFPFNVSKNFKSSKNTNDNDGPTVDDWTQLFEQMREKGIDSNMRPKEHWFEGQSLFTDVGMDDKKDWSDEDLLELWNMEGDDDD